MSDSRHIKKLLVHAAVGAGVGIGCGYAGTTILTQVGLNDYSAVDAACAGGMGSSILESAWGFLSSYNELEIGKKITKCSQIFGLIGLHTGIWAASGAFGSALLSTIVEIPIAQSAAAVATGAAAAGIALVILGGCYYLACCNKDDVEDFEDALDYTASQGHGYKLLS